MVLFYTSNALGDDNLLSIYAGKDKFENEDLIRYALENDIWFHVDKLSSPHIYLRLPASMTWDAIPSKVLEDCSQLVKAGSIEGNKKDNVTIIYTPSKNLKKTGDMDVGSVTFHNDKLVKRFHVPTRVNAVVNRLNKTKVVKEVDHEAELVARQKEASRVKKAEALQRKKEQEELAKQRKAEAEARSYDSVFANADPTDNVDDDDFM
ncbi:cytoplasmic protein [Atractiella rhizophila]|nr:cytoplasmic protein [Atractiella rhizophila]